MKLFILILIFIFYLGCSHNNKIENIDDELTVFVYAQDFFVASDNGDQALEEKFKEVLKYIGNSGKGGSVGIGFVFPYLAWTKGIGAGPYTIPKEILSYHESFVRAAAKLQIPLLIQFNGAVWHSPSENSAFLSFWKTVNGGEFLSRYKDGQVNESITQKENIPELELKKYLNADPYDLSRKDSLFFTLSPYATDFRKARLEALQTAVTFWKTLDDKYPGVIKALTTDSEVSTLSFRLDQSGKREISIGFEKWNTEPFCRENEIKDCREFFARAEFDYKTPTDLSWYNFRSKNHLKFVQDSVDTIRYSFPNQPIFTHQISVLDEEGPIRKHKNQDLASPQWTAFAKNAYPGFTVYTYAGDKYKTQQKFVNQVSEKLSGQTWGFLEFNTARAFNGSKSELAKFTMSFIDFSYKKGVRVIAPLAWETNNLDIGIKDSGVDDGIKAFIEEGGE